MQGKKLTYTGAVALPAENMTWEQLAPALLPKGVAGSVNTIDLADESLRPLLAEPRLALLP